MAALPADQASFVCNICDHACLAPVAVLTREAPSCARCGSNVRMRAIVHLLSTGLFGRSLALRDFPQDPGIRGLGLSDAHAYARPLAARLDYRNTSPDEALQLDITRIPEALSASCDFVIASEVFARVPAPVQPAFDGARSLLKPGGVLVLTAPFDPGAPTREHFPPLNDFRVVEEGGRRRLYNRGTDGSAQVFDDLVFHGGPGAPLEMRLFGLQDLMEHCLRAGFRDVATRAEAVPERGIYWPHPWSVPILARA